MSDNVYSAIRKANALIDYNIYNDIHKQYEFLKQTILTDESLTENEKSEAIRIFNKDYDQGKLIHNEGTKRICENCNQECLATLHCEHCVRNYLKTKFSNWTSGNDDINDLIQKCQMETFIPSKVMEWIPYSNLKNIKYLTKGVLSEIYVADWIGGCYNEWDSKEQQLIRLGTQKVVLKKFENVENSNQSWFEEVCNQNLFKN